MLPDQPQFHLLVWQELLEISDFFQMLVPYQVPHHPDWQKIEEIGQEKIRGNDKLITTRCKHRLLEITMSKGCIVPSALQEAKQPERT